MLPFLIFLASLFPCPVHRAAGCTAPCCSPAYTVTVGHRCAAAETGASVPDQGKQSEHTARNSQPAGLIFKNVCYSSTLKRNILDSPNRFKVSFAVLTKCALIFFFIDKDLIHHSVVLLSFLVEAVFHSRHFGIFRTKPVSKSMER